MSIAYLYSILNYDQMPENGIVGYHKIRYKNTCLCDVCKELIVEGELYFDVFYAEVPFSKICQGCAKTDWYC